MNPKKVHNNDTLADLEHQRLAYIAERHALRRKEEDALKAVLPITQQLRSIEARIANLDCRIAILQSEDARAWHEKRRQIAERKRRSLTRKTRTEKDQNR